MSEEKHLIVGIDPDVDKNGVSAWNVKSKSFEFITSMTLHELISYIAGNQQKIKTVVVEAGWLNNSNFHLNKQNSIRAAAKTGENTGRNSQRGIDIVEIMEWFGVPCRLQKPLSNNTWKKDELMFKKITGVKGGNPEMRDSAMLVFNATR